MKVSELDHDNGTYAELIPDRNSRSILIGLQKHFNIQNPVTPADLHMTLIYSRTPCPDISQLADTFSSITGTVIGFKYLPGKEGKQLLVAEIDSTEAVNMHHMIRESYGASHDYPSYLSHITLSYDCPSSLRSIQSPVDIVFDRFKVSELEP